MLTGGVSAAAAAVDSELPPGGTFTDDNLMEAEGSIEAIFAEGITVGCNPPASDRFCPYRIVNRAEMASFLVRALDLPATAEDYFIDDGHTIHEGAINRLAASGITKGCGDPDGKTYCPDRPIKRGEMAAFLVRAMGYVDDGGKDWFTDDGDSIFETDINRLAAAGVTKGCNPPANDAYCHTATLPRSQMAIFLVRALHLTPRVPPPPPKPKFPQVGHGKRIIYGNSAQRVWLVDANEQLVDTYLVSGRRGVPRAGTYRVFSKSLKAWGPGGTVTMRHMIRYTWGNRYALGFHSIPRRHNGTPIQTEAQLGTFRSSGCTRQSDAKAKALYAWAPIGTTVVVLP
jgi:hypothetical protein